MTDQDTRRVIYVLGGGSRWGWFNAKRAQRPDYVGWFAAGYGQAGETFEAPDLPRGVKKERVNSYAPFLPQAVDDIDLTFHKGAPRQIPDWFPFEARVVVSDKFKSVIEKVDPDGEHQFIPVRVMDRNHRDHLGKWFYFIVGRRFLAWPEGGPEEEVSLSTESDRFGGDRSMGKFSNIEWVEFFLRQLVWADLGSESNIYVSSKVFAEFVAAGLTGLEEYTQQLGRSERIPGPRNDFRDIEFVAHIWFDPPDAQKPKWTAEMFPFAE